MSIALTNAQLNHTAETVAAAKNALNLARAQGHTAEADQIEAWIKSHEAAGSQ